MIKLNIEQKEYKIASEWKDITFGQYIDILDIEKDTFNPIDKSVEIIAALSDNKEECKAAIYKLDSSDFVSLGDYFKWISTDFEKELKKMNKKKPTNDFKIDGVTYTMKDDYDKLTIGEMVSAELLVQNNKNLHPLEIGFGVLLREVGEDGKPKEFTEEGFVKIVTSLKDKVKLVDIYSYIAFFLSGEKNSTTKSSQGFSISKI